MSEKFKLKLNLFDAVILLVALLVGAMMLWQTLDMNTTTYSSNVLEYTVTMKEVREGTTDFIMEGSEVYDVLRNYHLGTVISAESKPAEKQVLNHMEKAFQTSHLEGYEDVEIKMKIDVTETSTAILADGGYEIRVGSILYLRGAGYMGVGYVTEMERLN